MQTCKRFAYIARKIDFDLGIKIHRTRVGDVNSKRQDDEVYMK